jgi:putative ABC transport system permease protein
MRLNEEHIDFVVKDLHRRGILLDDLEDEIIDHVCSAVEGKMNDGQRFIEAYNDVIQSFGNNPGLQQTQKETASTLMFKSYFLVALRNHLKQRFYTVINIGGLAIGVASVLIISLFVVSELSYDKHFPNADRVYRVNGEIKFGPNHFNLASTSPGLQPLIAHDYPEVESSVRLQREGDRFLRQPDGSETIKVDNVFWADSTLFSVLQIPLVEGSAGDALKEASSIAISKSLADKYFGGKPALGQSIMFSGINTEYRVRAVFEDLPPNSHLHPQLVMAMEGNPEGFSSSLVSGGDYITYVLLRPGVTKESLEAKFDLLVDRYVAPQIQKVVGGDFTIENFRASGQVWDYTLIGIGDIHLHSDRLGEIEANGSMTYVILLSSIGALILGIACVNFVNLSTARSAGRAREIGVRKAMGSLRSHLIRQFLVESTLLTFVAFALSLGLAWLLIPYFNELAQQSLQIPFSNPVFYILFIVGAFVIGIASGLYPSFFLSAFKPIKVLRGQTSRGSGTSVVRSSLVVFQFMISIFLIIGTIVIQRQLNFIQERKLGFHKDQVLVIREAYNLGSHVKEYKDEMLKNSFVQSGTVSGFLPVSGTYRSNNTYWPEGADQNDMTRMVSLNQWSVDDEYIKTLGMKVIQGREFNPLQTSDSDACIINQAAVRVLGFGNNPVGKTITTIVGSKDDGLPDPNAKHSWTVIGVVEDFHFESMKSSIEPMALFLRPSTGHMAFRFDAAHTNDVLRTAEQAWKQMSPDRPFIYSFLDDDFAKMYSNEQRLGKIFMTFSILAIIIACLGLFGLTAFTAEQRTKEIGIRKVLGASVPGIVVLLSKEFGLLVLIAYVIAVPAAWYTTNWWLEGYTYKTEIGVFVYVLAGVSAFVVAWVTMSYQSIRAALANPVKSLRSE